MIFFGVPPGQPLTRLPAMPVTRRTTLKSRITTWNDDLNIGVVQLDYTPALAVHGHSTLREPARELSASALRGLHQLEKTLAGAPKLAEARAELAGWRDTLEQRYVALHERKLLAIASKAREQHLDLLVFPEYSVPCSLVRPLARVFGGMALVAGTHTITEFCGAEKGCRGFAGDFKDTIGMSYAPVVVTASGQAAVHPIFKSGNSQWESGVPTKRAWKPIELRKNGDRYQLVVSICIDFIDEALQRSRASKPSGRDASLIQVLHVVPALTPRAADFDRRSLELIRKNEIVLFANSSWAGGSRIYFNNQATQHAEHLRCDKAGTAQAGPADEVLITAVVGPCRAAHFGPLSPVPEPQPRVRATGLIPICYRVDAPDHTMLAQLQGAHQRRETVADANANGSLASALPMMRSVVARDNLAHLLVDHSAIPGSDLEALTAAVLLPLTVPRMEEWRYRSLLATALLLRGLTGRTSPSGQAVLRPTFMEIAQAADATSRVASLHFSFQPYFESNGTRGAMSPSDMLSDAATAAAFLVSSPSSGEVERALVDWIYDALESKPIADEFLRDLPDVLRLVEQLRPFPARPTILEIHKCLAAGDPDALRRKCEELSRSRATRAHALQKQAEMLPSNWARRILSFGYSEAVLAVLEVYAGRPRTEPRLAVHVSECPNRFGWDSAPAQGRWLERLNIQRLHVAGSSLARHLSQPVSSRPDRMVMGCNAIVPEGIVNTAGSLGTALLAEANGIPVTVIATADRATNRVEDLRAMLAESRPSAGIVDAASPAENAVDHRVAHAYDLIPWRLISELMTEAGIRRPDGRAGGTTG